MENITIGAAISIVSVIAAGVGVYTNLQNKISVMRSEIDELKVKQNRDREELRDELHCIKVELKEISQQLNQLLGKNAGKN